MVRWVWCWRFCRLCACASEYRQSKDPGSQTQQRKLSHQNPALLSGAALQPNYPPTIRCTLRTTLSGRAYRPHR